MKMYSSDPIQFSDGMEEIIDLCSKSSNTELKNLAGFINSTYNSGRFTKTLAAKGKVAFSGELDSKYGKGVFLIKAVEKADLGEKMLMIDKLGSKRISSYKSLSILENQGVLTACDEETGNKVKVSFRIKKFPLVGKKIVCVKEIDLNQEDESGRGL